MELKSTHLALLVLAILATSYYNVSMVKAQYPYQYPPPLPLPLPLPLPPPPPSPLQSSSSSCVNKLFPCLKYLNSTRDPPHSCCDPLKSVIKSEPECLCKLISTQGAFQAQLIGINVSEVELLPGRCGQHVNPIGCLTGSSRNSVHGSAGVGPFPSLVLLAFGALLMIILL